MFALATGPFNTLAPIAVPEDVRVGYTPFPPHVYDESGVCAFCGTVPSQQPYAAYVERHYAEAWEPGNEPLAEPEWAWLNNTCLATLPDEWAGHAQPGTCRGECRHHGV